MFARNKGWKSHFNKSVGANIIVYDGADQPDDNEIFMLKQPITSVYEFRPFNDFRRTKTFEIPATSINNVGAPFILNYSNDVENRNQRFTIECETCDPNANSLHWAKYHTSCLIKNIASLLCATGENVSQSNVTQVDCSIATRWDLWGIISPDAISSSTTTSFGSPTMATSMSNSTSGISTGLISAGGLIAAVFGSIIGTALISFIAGYWIIKRKQLFKNELLKDPVNVQIVNH
ncbi:hypothetical protein RclHR1_00470024 [Rhizophagus clarus]|uniref:Uncharacterized protein n=1 Tax=Rhizophagus clarus TaxID=94130 RepID=A0A2Z6RK11_9GLOM|nr:hypothetical protein RclHR1_00470024 [Rhizophagus clarus]